MYESFYKLNSDPFRLLPDPEVCFSHRSCARAWAYLRYSIKRGEGIVVVTGPPGSGKSTLAERLLAELNRSKVVGLRLVAGELEPVDLMRRLAYALGLAVEGMDPAMLAYRIERHLLELEPSHRRALVVVDEAQTLSPRALEALRRLTDLQSHAQPVLQLVLLGQEELEEVLAAPWMEQFQQRVIASCRLERMSLKETKAYLEYRLELADWIGDPSISGAAVKAIFDASRGLPRQVNKICSRLLLYGSAEEKHALNEADVSLVVRDLREELLAPLDDDSVVQTAEPEVSGEALHALALVPLLRNPVADTAPPESLDDDRYLGDSPATGLVQGPGQHRPSHAAQSDRLSAHASRADGYRPDFASYRAIRLRARDYWQGLIDWLGWRSNGSVGGRVRPVKALWGRALQAGVAGAAGAVSRQLPPAFEKAKDLGSLPAWLRSPNVALAASFAVVVGVAGIVVWYPGDRQPLLTVRVSDDGSDARPVKEDAVSSAPMPLRGPADSIPTALRGAGPDARLAGPPLQPRDAAEPDVAPDAVSLDGAHHRLGEIVETPIEPAESSYIGSSDDRVSDAVDPKMETLAPPGSGIAQVEPVAALPDDHRAIVEPAIVATNDAGGDLHSTTEVQQGGGSESNPPVVLVLGADDTLRQDHVRLQQASVDGGDEVVGYVDAAAELPYVTPLLPDVRVVEETALTDSAAASSLELGGDAAVATASTVPDAQEVALLTASLEEAKARKAQETARLLALANEAIAADRLLMPEANSAHRYLQQVFALDAENAQARAGIERIVRRYAELARNALGEGTLDKAELFIGRGLRVDADSATIRTVEAEVQQAIAEAEAAAVRAAELERMAAEYVPPAPVVEVEPEREPPSSFERLMRVLNGL